MRGVLRSIVVVLAGVALSLPAGEGHGQSIDDVVDRHFGFGGPGTGAVLGVDDGSDQLFLDAWGRPAAGRDSLTADHLFPFPGMTEVLVATAIRSLHTRGSLDVDAPIGETLTELPAPLHPITLNQLLRHTAGLDDARVPEGSTLEDVVDGLSGRALFTDPGAVYSRSRYSYPLAVRVLEQTFALPLPEILGPALFDPLGMTRSTFDESEASRMGLAVGYQQSPERTQPGTPADPVTRAAGLPVLFSTVPDLLRFFSAWMRGSIRGAGADELPEPPPYPAVATPLADGFYRTSYQISDALRVSFRSDGYAAVASLVPEAGVATVAWANADLNVGLGGLPEQAVTFVTERLLGSDFPVQVVDEVDAPELRLADPEPLADWTGRYFNGDELVVLRPPETEGVEAGLVFFDGQRELPVRRVREGRNDLVAVLPNDEQRVAVRFHVFLDAEGRAYVYMGSKSYRRPLDGGNGVGGTNDQVRR